MRSMASVHDKAILLTGASSGIGEETARLLAARGARLALVARREQRLRQLSDELVAAGYLQPLVIGADLSVRGQAAEVAAHAIETFGELDVLINNAGASLQGLTWIAGDRDEARAIFETNFWSPLALAAAVAPGMIERGRGLIVNTGSMVQVSPFPHLGHYCASRAALASITQTMRLELDKRGVDVVEVAFGAVDTAASRENRLLRGGQQWLEGRPGIGRLEDAARTLVRAVEHPSKGVLFYPGVLRWVHSFPGLGRGHAKRAAKNSDLSDTAMRVGGSTGTPEIRAAREEWERRRADV